MFEIIREIREAIGKIEEAILSRFPEEKRKQYKELKKRYIGSEFSPVTHKGKEVNSRKIWVIIVVTFVISLTLFMLMRVSAGNR